MANELRQLVDTANATIFGIDVHGNVNEWNDKTAEITGFSKEEAFNRPMVSTFIEPKLQESVQTVLDNALHGNETSNYQLEFRTKSNETRYLLVNATTRRDADSNIVGVVGVAQDGEFIRPVSSSSSSYLANVTCGECAVLADCFPWPFSCILYFPIPFNVSN